MQNRDPNSPSSFFRIAGIHGLPHESYADVEEPPGRVFCEHHNALFPTWHRPYTLLLESTIRATAKRLVGTITDVVLRRKYEMALSRLRLPYWDWAITSSVPSILTDRLLSIEHVDGTTRRIPNPLREYHFQKSAAERLFHLPNVSAGATTTRHAGNDEQLVDELHKEHSRLRDGWCAALQATRYDQLFIDGRTVEDADQVIDDDVSLFTAEHVHDLMHMVLGGHGGHMNYVPTAAFDPVFFLHHANVDRHVALWQATHPDAWLEDGHFAWGKAISAETTALAPFKNDDFTVATPNSVRNTAALGYVYADAVRPEGLPPSNRLHHLLRTYRCRNVTRRMWYAKLVVKDVGYGSLVADLAVYRPSQPRRTVAFPLRIFLGGMQPPPDVRFIFAVDITKAIEELELRNEEMRLGRGSDFEVDVQVSTVRGLPLSMRLAGVEKLQIFEAPSGVFGPKTLLTQKTGLNGKACAYDYDCTSCETCDGTSRQCILR